MNNEERNWHNFTIGFILGSLFNLVQTEKERPVKPKNQSAQDAFIADLEATIKCIEDMLWKEVE